MDIEAIAKGLTPAQREWVMLGPYNHWTNTKRALAKKGIHSLVGMRGMNDTGLAVRDYLIKEGK